MRTRSFIFQWEGWNATSGWLLAVCTSNERWFHAKTIWRAPVLQAIDPFGFRTNWVFWPRSVRQNLDLSDLFLSRRLFVWGVVIIMARRGTRQGPLNCWTGLSFQTWLLNIRSQPVLCVFWRRVNPLLKPFACQLLPENLDSFFRAHNLRFGFHSLSLFDVSQSFNPTASFAEYPTGSYSVS